jgi:hypothetical protein
MKLRPHSAQSFLKANASAIYSPFLQLFSIALTPWLSPEFQSGTSEDEPNRLKTAVQPVTMFYFFFAFSRISSAISFISVRLRCISLHPYHKE